MINHEFATPTVNNNNLLKFPTFETDEDIMACSNSEPTDKPHQRSNECISSRLISSFSQNFSKELCYSQAPSYNKPSRSNQSEFHKNLSNTGSCEVVITESKCSKPSYENNPMEKLMFMPNNYFSSSKN